MFSGSCSHCFRRVSQQILYKPSKSVWKILSCWSLYFIKIFHFKNNMIKLTGMVVFLARMHIKENTYELISTVITNRRKEYLLCDEKKYSVICSMAIFILKLNVNTLKLFSVYWENIQEPSMFWFLKIQNAWLWSLT